VLAVATQHCTRPARLLRGLRVQEERQRPQARPAAGARPVDEDHAARRRDDVRQDKIRVDEPLGQSLRRVQRGDLRPERVERRTLGVGNEGRGPSEHPASGRDLSRRQPVGEVMPGTARPRDRPIANANAASACCRRRVQRVQAAEQRAEVARLGQLSLSQLARARRDLNGLRYADGIQDSLYRAVGRALIARSPAGAFRPMGTLHREG